MTLAEAPSPSPLEGKPLAHEEKGGHRLVEHTADIGIHCWGSTLEELFRQAARGLLDVMLGPIRVEGSEEREVDLHAGSREELLVTWLNELLYLFEVQGRLPAEVSFARLDGTQLRARLWLANYRDNPRPLERQVKAATYHQLQVSRSAHGWQATIYLDL